MSCVHWPFSVQMPLKNQRTRVSSWNFHIGTSVKLDEKDKLKQKEGLTRGQRGSSESPLLHNGGEKERGRGGKGRWRCLGMWQLWWKERRMTEDKRWRREVVEQCALFIPADTSESLIHLEKGISQVTTYLLAFTHMHTKKHWHMNNTHTQNCN